MTDANTDPRAERFRESARAMLQRRQSLHSRQSPPLNALRSSVDRVVARWPDAVRSPEDRDRERLATEMLGRVTAWHAHGTWEHMTTQRVASAAIAVFDEERRDRPKLAPVRDFYVSEITSCAPGAFLDGMVGVYLETFADQGVHTRDLGEALQRRANDIGARHQKLLAAMPDLFFPKRAAEQMVRRMLDAKDAYTDLKSIGITAPHASGLARTASRLFVEKIAPDLASPAAREKLFRWITPDTGSVMQSGARHAVEALLEIWRNKTPTDETRNDLTERIIAAYNDPRLHSGGIWSGFDQGLKRLFLQWLTRQDMKFFCDMVTATQNSHMWPPRRDFWLKLYDDKMIDEAWVAFGSEARRYAQQNLVRDGKTDMTRRFGRQLDRGGSTSLLIMRIGNKIVVDGCHSYRTHVFRRDDPSAPQLYQRTYNCDRIMRASRNAKPHNSIRNWSQWVLQNV